MASNPYEGLQDFVGGLPDLVQPLIVAGLGMIPYVEGEGSAAIGIIVGINPVVAAVAGAAGNILSVVLVVLLSSRVRDSVVARRARAADGAVAVDVLDSAGASTDEGKPTRRSKGRKRLSSWLVRFGVPGASILAPFALPTQLTAAFFVASGVKKGWVILWQVVAIVLWTGLVAAAALGFVTLLGWG
ncbi:small multidrug efflux protein [Microbacterium sp. ET2]|uniref:small multidrug efflux protein n=1 Tax=Microbacterium albipurpureum TaxID=3050384 RepID=UPI00259CA8E0|nr:small multidrug efflux protein [Microbacterium sp. ET2 (Ac-2212)]WJL96616.1 small multidrug efflux protein [Microbacterium sp. ET2 (Ac-2212)]